MKRVMYMALSSLILLTLFAAPAQAGISLSLNNQYAGKDSTVVIVDGRGLVSLDTIDRLFGADITVADGSIKVVENDKILQMESGSTEASLNGTAISMAAPPQIIDQKLMVPLASVCEALGAKLTWMPERERIDVVYKETRNDLTAVDVMAKYMEECKSLNTYKFDGKTLMTTQVSISGLTEGTPGNMTMNVDERMTGSISQEPVQAIMSIKMKIDSPDASKGQSLGTQNMDIYMNEDCMFMRMPDGTLVKMNLESINIKGMLQNQGGLQDPKALLEEFQKNNVIMSFDNDESIKGVDYWIISTTIDSDTFNKMFQGIMEQINGVIPVNKDSSDQSMKNFMNDFLHKMQMNMTMKFWIDQKTSLVRYADGDINMQMRMPLPSKEGQSGGSMDMNMQGTTSMEYYDYGGKLVWPNLDKAISFNQYLIKNITVSQQ